ncbi:amino acid aminotransferase [Candidatus Parcubacteria bacterium]|nr:MAG: amino acid aminotransferase [Candidatus Parcubacteria bacterium]
MQKSYCYFNGKIVLADKAFLHPDDLGILRGFGVFDVLKTANGKIFLFDKHFKRLSDSAASLGIKLPVSKEEIVEAIKILIKKNKINEASIRIVLTGGRMSASDGMHFDFDTPTFYILVSEFKPLAKELFERGVKLAAVDYNRDMAETKTLNYIMAVREINKRQAKEKFFEILYVSGDGVLEAATSNFFAFVGSKLVAPKEGILKGITRNLVIDLAKKEFEVEERKLTVDELESASEAFIAATNKDILPVVKIDKLKIGSGKPGKNTKRLMRIFEEFLKNY